VDGRFFLLTLNIIYSLCVAFGVGKSNISTKLAFLFRLAGKRKIEA
jgi:hypothetical protein